MYKNKKERKKTRKSSLIMFGCVGVRACVCVCVCVCVVTSTFRLARLTCVPPEQDPQQNEEHSRRLMTVQLILQQTFVGQCVYIRAPFMMS